MNEPDDWIAISVLALFALCWCVGGLWMCAIAWHYWREEKGEK